MRKYDKRTWWNGCKHVKKWNESELWAFITSTSLFNLIVQVIDENKETYVFEQMNKISYYRYYKMFFWKKKQKQLQSIWKKIFLRINYSKMYAVCFALFFKITEKIFTILNSLTSNSISKFYWTNSKYSLVYPCFLPEQPDLFWGVKEMEPLGEGC